MKRTMAIATFAVGLATAASAQVGAPLPDVQLADFTATEAKSLRDFHGRLLLIEYFAYW